MYLQVKLGRPFNIKSRLEGCENWNEPTRKKG